MKIKSESEEFNKNHQSYFSKIFDLFRNNLNSNLDEKIRIFPIDTGLGKSTIIRKFLREWKAKGFGSGESCILFLSTVEEICRYIEAIGFDRNEVAVVTRNEEANSLGSDNPNQSRLVLTTHAMLRFRTLKKSFSKASEFYFQGKPRGLRIADEGLYRAEHIHLGRDSLLQVIEPLRPYFPEWVEGLEKFATHIHALKPNSIIRFPNAFGKGRQYSSVEYGGPKLMDKQKQILQHIRAARGRQLRAVSGKKYGITLIGMGHPLPADIGPLFIFDASARVVENYQLWADVDSNVEIMDSLVRDYDNLLVCIWKTACGRDFLANPTNRDKLLRPIAKMLNADERKTLLVGYMNKGDFDLFEELKSYLDKPELLHFRHWGNHHGTNEFRDIDRLVVIGCHLNRDTVYQAMHMAATGADPDSAIGNEWTQMRQGHLKGNLLQAFSRGTVRQGENGQCGKCDVYFIAPPNPSPETLVREAFPNCRIEAWEPVEKALTGHAKAIVDAVGLLRAQGRLGDVPKAEIRELAGIASESGFANVLKKEVIVAALAKFGVEVAHKHFVFNPSADVIPIKSHGEQLMERRIERLIAA
jgi:hypothetical protein